MYYTGDWIFVHTWKLTKIIIYCLHIHTYCTLHTRLCTHTYTYWGHCYGSHSAWKLSPGCLLTTGYKAALHYFNVFPHLERTHTSVRPSIDLNQYGPISSTPLSLAYWCLSCGALGLRDELHLSLARSIPFEVIGLMCSPEPWCVQPPVSPHHLSAALIRGSLNGTRLGRPSVLSA